MYVREREKERYTMYEAHHLLTYLQLCTTYSISSPVPASGPGPAPILIVVLTLIPDRVPCVLCALSLHYPT